jgi:prepilin-type N-terminal cleavage/methylation domain-containing protein
VNDCSKIKSAFTLAEVLITLLIIGVVASMVVPNIIMETQKAELKESFRKTFSDIDQATKLIAVDNGGTIAGTFTGRDSLKNLYAEKLKTIKSCNSGYSDGNCWHPAVEGSIKNYNGSNFIYWANDWSSIILVNGSFVYFDQAIPACNGQYSGLLSPVSCGLIWIDVNGAKPPNTFHKDIFEIHLIGTRAVPRGSPLYDNGYRNSYYALAGIDY